MMGLLSVRKTKKISGKAGGGEGSDHEGDNGKGASGSPSGTGSSPSNSGNNNDNNGGQSGPGFSQEGINNAIHGGQPDAFSGAANPGFGYSGKADFSGGLNDGGSYGGIGVGSVSSGNYDNNGYSLGTMVDFSSPLDNYDNYGGLTGLSGAYGSGLMESPGLWDNINSFVMSNPLAIAGGLLGFGIGGPLGALGFSKLGSTADDVTNPNSTAMDRMSGIMGLTGAPGLMSMAAKGINSLSEKMGGTNPNPGVNPSPTTDGANDNNFSSVKYNQPKIEYKFDPFGQSGGLLSNNGKISYSQLNRLVDQLRQQTGGLLSKVRNTNLGGI